MVYTQKKEVPPEPELGPGWRKVEVKRDNRVVKTLTKYWNPQGKELSYEDVKKILDSAQGKTKRCMTYEELEASKYPRLEIKGRKRENELYGNIKEEAGPSTGDYLELDELKAENSEDRTRKQKLEVSPSDLVTKMEFKAEVRKDWDQNVEDVLRPFSGTDFIKEEYSEVETRKQKQDASLNELVTKIELKKEVLTVGEGVQPL